MASLTQCVAEVSVKCSAHDMISPRSSRWVFVESCTATAYLRHGHALEKPNLAAIYLNCEG